MCIFSRININRSNSINTHDNHRGTKQSIDFALYTSHQFHLHDSPLREKEREGKGERERDRETEKERQRETERERERGRVISTKKADSSPIR